MLPVESIPNPIFNAAIDAWMTELGRLRHEEAETLEAAIIALAQGVLFQDIDAAEEVPGFKAARRQAFRTFVDEHLASDAL